MATRWRCTESSVPDSEGVAVSRPFLPREGPDDCTGLGTVLGASPGGSEGPV